MRDGGLRAQGRIVFRAGELVLATLDTSGVDNYGGVRLCPLPKSFPFV